MEMPESSLRATADGNIVTQLAGVLGHPDWTKPDEMLAGFPPGIPILPQEDTGKFARYRHKPDRVYAKDEAWQKCGVLMEKYDAEFCKGHREEIDTLLVFAGLFSAVVAGFTVESYRWLQNDPNDAIVSLLSQISHSVSPNGTTTAIDKSSSGMPHSVSVRINVYWFVSLTLSLATALLAILGKQWVREYERHAPMPPDDYVGVRQVKFEGIVYWKVGDIISSLPLLLQLSLALFSLGVIELLWNLDIAVGIAVCIPTVLTVLFYLATTLLPLCHFVYHRSSRARTPYIPPCAYKSPQALVAMRAYTLVIAAWRGVADAISFVCRWLSRRFCSGLRKPGSLAKAGPEAFSYDRPRVEAWHTWAVWDKAFADVSDDRNMARIPSAYSRGLRWLVREIDEPAVRELVWNCLWDKGHGTTGFERTRAGIGLRMDLEHPFGDHFRLAAYLTPRLALARSIGNTSMREGFQCEILIQNFREELDLGTAAQFLRAVPARLDRDLTLGLVRVLSAYCRRHVLEDLTEVFLSASNILDHCPDSYTCDALRSCIILGMLNWIRSWTFIKPMEVSVSPTIGPSMARVLTSIISRLHEPFETHLAGLHALPHVAQLAALLNAYCVLRGQRVTWPLSEDFDFREIRLTSSRNIPPVVLELLRISVCGVSHSAKDAAYSSTSAPREDKRRNNHRVPADPRYATAPGASSSAGLATSPGPSAAPHAGGESQLHPARTRMAADDAVLGRGAIQNEHESDPPPYARAEHAAPVAESASGASASPLASPPSEGVARGAEDPDHAAPAQHSELGRPDATMRVAVLPGGDAASARSVASHTVATPKSADADGPAYARSGSVSPTLRDAPSQEGVTGSASAKGLERQRRPSFGSESAARVGGAAAAIPP